MKKVLLSLGVALLTAVGAQAQVGYGVKAGLNFPKLNYSGGNVSYTTSAATNFYLSGYASIPAATNFAIQPGVSLQGKGGKVEVGSLTTTRNLMSIEIPVNAVYYIPTGATGSVFVAAGPYVGFNVSGKDKAGDVKTDIKFGSKDDQLKVVDYGVNFQLGYKLSNGLLINGGYGLGLGNMSNVDALKIKNNVFSVGIGFEI
ncbi:outer membrane beta-barrel protein [Sphingobacterium faecale]|uniref:PorT family protein n=1 Tax=Sphingobacterium faecale TaxID=2803775 RepID=A0ABS1R5C3_9SPHI|nr:outer membrane beta-barrel protein [Sphingobacterium faecale]MBL1409892.1 PorT family protein [Sphingobacterium faecale]